MTDELPGNSHSQKDNPLKSSTPAPKEKKKPEPIQLQGELNIRKRSLSTRFRTVFLGGDFKNAARYVAAEVILPAFRNLIVSAGEEGLKRVVYGETARQMRRPVNYTTRTRYDNPLRPEPRMQQQSQYRPNVREQLDIGELILTHKEDADNVVEQLLGIWEEYKTVGLDDLYHILQQPIAHTDALWGWTNLSGISVQQVRDGYLINLPKPEAL